MIRAVFDCNVIIAALGWRGNPRFCLDLVYAGQVSLCVTAEVWQEYSEKVPLVLSQLKRPVNADAELGRLLRVAQFTEPVELGKRRSRDVKDDKYLAAALGAGADCLVTSDRDLLSLGKPFGVPMLSPVELLHRARGFGEG